MSLREVAGALSSVSISVPSDCVIATLTSIGECVCIYRPMGATLIQIIGHINGRLDFGKPTPYTLEHDMTSLVP